MKKKSCYIVTKPIQYVNATNIEDDNIKECYITNSFYNAANFVRVMNDCSSYWNKIYLVSSKQQALQLILKKKTRYSRLYLDSDMGIILRVFLLLLYPIKVYVYEEGLASYLASIRRNTGKKNYIKFFIDFFLGKDYSGGALRTNGIYLYHPNAFKSLINVNEKKQIYSFKQPLINHVNSLSEIKAFYSDEKFEFLRGQKILLYLTSWTLNPLYVETYNKYTDYIKIIKFHPHIKKELVLNDLLHFDFYPDSTIPAEILIAKLIEIGDEIVIIHESTAAMLNFVDEKDIIEYNIADTKYRDIYLKIKNEFETKVEL